MAYRTRVKSEVITEILRTRRDAQDFSTKFHTTFGSRMGFGFIWIRTANVHLAIRDRQYSPIDYIREGKASDALIALKKQIADGSLEATWKEYIQEEENADGND